MCEKYCRTCLRGLNQKKLRDLAFYFIFPILRHRAEISFVAPSNPSANNEVSDYGSSISNNIKHDGFTLGH